MFCLHILQWLLQTVQIITKWGQIRLFSYWCGKVIKFLSKTDSSLWVIISCWICNVSLLTTDRPVPTPSILNPSKHQAHATQQTGRHDASLRDIKYSVFGQGLWPFKHTVLRGQVEHDLLKAVRKPKKGKQRRVLASLGSPSTWGSQVHWVGSIWMEMESSDCRGPTKYLMLFFFTGR